MQPALGGSVRLLDADLDTADTSHCVYSIVEGDPLSAEVGFHAVTSMGRGDWTTTSEVMSSMTCDAETFYVDSRLEVRENGDEVFARDWKLEFPRDNV
jgi:uncharacterized protein